MSTLDRYISAAIGKWGGDSDISIDTDSATVDTSPSDGAWVTALLWVSDPPNGGSINDWYAVVSEQDGGIIAYFLREKDALAFIDTLAPADAGE